MLVPITALFAGLALAKPLGSLPVDSVETQQLERAVTPRDTVMDDASDFAYECIPVENGPWEDCRGIDYYLSDRKDKYGSFQITLFTDRCWTLMSGVCRLYVCMNGQPGAQTTIDGEKVRSVLSDKFQNDCNADNQNLAGYAWNKDHSIEIFSGVA